MRNFTPRLLSASPLVLLALLLLSSQSLLAQDPLNRSVQVSVKTQEDPPRFDFSWEWDWSDGGYNVYKKSPDEPVWGSPIAQLPFGTTAFSDTDIQVGTPYEYAFYKKGFEKIIDTFDVAAGAELTFSIHNIYGDGLCCNFGFGWYEVAVCGGLVAQGSDFGFEKSTVFSVCDNGSPTEKLILTIHPDMQVNNTYWRLTDASGNEVATSGPVGTWLDDRPKYGYILAGIKLPIIEKRGSILLLVDNVYINPLSEEIAQLETDLIADGWKVIRKEINRNEEVTAVKSLIVNEYDNNADLSMLYMLGHIPVPYSGSIYPDGHVENHWGAWAADVYYGDINGVWTDETVNNTTAQFAYNHNVPGDGKFDQSAIPSKVELAVGRVDLYNMPAFGLNDIELTRRYLQKAHLFKTAERAAGRRALVDDNLNVVLASPAASGWRNFAPMFSADSVQALDYFSTMKNDSYLWSYGCGGGSHISADGIGTSQDFASDTLKNIFTMLLGSQFGDWDNENNFLRAPLASPSWTLTSCWAGNPPYIFHKMATGEPIGFSLLATQNSTAEDYYPGPRLVHTSLMGDPALRLHYVKPPTDLIISKTDQVIHISWQAPDNEEVAGYYIYRLDTISGEFIRLNNEPIDVANFTDPLPPDGLRTYMVKTVKLETSGSGTYWDLSLGVKDSVQFQFVSKIGEAVENQWVVYPNPAQGQLFLSGNIDLINAGIELINAQGEVVKIWEGLKNGVLDVSRFPTGVYFLKIENEQGAWMKKTVLGD